MLSLMTPNSMFDPIEHICDVIMSVADNNIKKIYEHVLGRKWVLNGGLALGVQLVIILPLLLLGHPEKLTHSQRRHW